MRSDCTETGTTPATKSVEKIIKKNNARIETKNATIWFEVFKERKRETAVNNADNKNTPKYPTKTSGKYNDEPTDFVKTDNETGRPRVNVSEKAIRVSTAKNLDRRIWISETGKLNNSSMVFSLRSSANILMLSAGTKIISSHGTRTKNGFIDASPTEKMSFTYKKFANAENNTTIMYPIGLLR